MKLERALALSRKKVAELKRMVSDADARADQAAIDKLVASIAEPKALKQKPVKQKLTATRGRRKKAEAVAAAEPDEQDEPVLDEATGEAETEAHAS